MTMKSWKLPKKPLSKRATRALYDKLAKTGYTGKLRIVDCRLEDDDGLVRIVPIYGPH